MEKRPSSKLRIELGNPLNQEAAAIKTDENQTPNTIKVERKVLNQAIRPKSQHLRKISANLRYL